jgi:predicted transcriptional regulator
MNTLTSTQERALSLLGKGVSPEQTALALGVTPSAISQLLSEEEFAEEVAKLRFTNLAKHSERDEKADLLEDALLERVKDLLPFISRPLEAVRAYQIINSAKRRGQSTPESITAQNEVVQLVMPVQIINQYTVNSHNQVIKAGEKDLITMQSGGMQKFLAKNKGPQDVKSLPSPAESIGSSS